MCRQDWRLEDFLVTRNSFRVSRSSPLNILFSFILYFQPPLWENHNNVTVLDPLPNAEIIKRLPTCPVRSLVSQSCCLLVFTSPVTHPFILTYHNYLNKDGKIPTRHYRRISVLVRVLRRMSNSGDDGIGTLKGSRGGQK